jgi:hypothetical protein
MKKDTQLKKRKNLKSPVTFKKSNALEMDDLDKKGKGGNKKGKGGNKNKDIEEIVIEDGPTNKEFRISK